MYICQHHVKILCLLTYAYLRTKACMNSGKIYTHHSLVNKGSYICAKNLWSIYARLEKNLERRRLQPNQWFRGRFHTTIDYLFCGKVWGAVFPRKVQKGSMTHTVFMVELTSYCVYGWINLTASISASRCISYLYAHLHMLRVNKWCGWFIQDSLSIFLSGSDF